MKLIDYVKKQDLRNIDLGVFKKQNKHICFKLVTYCDGYFMLFQSILQTLHVFSLVV